MKIRVLAFIVIVLLLNIGVSAQSADSVNVSRGGIVHHFGVDLRGGYAFSSSGLSSDDLASDADIYHTATSFHAKYAFSFGDSTRLGRLYPGAYQGVGLGVNTFFASNNTISPVSLYLFQGAPIYHFSSRLSLGYEWNFGASFGWKKSDDTFGYNTNLIVGSKVNAVINLGLMLDYRLTRQFTLRGGVEGTHYSNGNTSLPNPGVNALGLRLGVVYTPNGESFAKKEKTAQNENYDASVRGLDYDFLLYGAWRKAMIENGNEKNAIPGHFGVAGVSIAPMWQFNRYFRAGVSADVQYDESSNLQKYQVDGTAFENVKFYRQPFKECLMGGLSARAELVMPVFSVNVGFGRNILAVSDNRYFYQTVNLKVQLPSDFWLNVGYRLHDFHSPDNLIFGVGYTLR